MAHRINNEIICVRLNKFHELRITMVPEKKDSYKKGLISSLISILSGLLMSIISYLVVQSAASNHLNGMAALGDSLALILLTTIIFFGVTIIVNLVYTILYIREKQNKALNVVVINVLVLLWIIALAIKFYK
jgi:hypothetical protein